jgi:glycosyltransferase involved in cell wall biosynthesis
MRESATAAGAPVPPARLEERIAPGLPVTSAKSPGGEVSAGSVLGRREPGETAPVRPAHPAMHVMHVITSLGSGGAQAMLTKLVSATLPMGLRHSVIALLDGGIHAEALLAAGVPVAFLGMRRGVPDLRAVARLTRLMRSSRPDVIQSWMYHADLVAGLAAAGAGRVPVVWGVHHSTLDPARTRWLTRRTAGLCAGLSGLLPARIVCCADAALHAHAAIGYRTERMVVIPNGFDLERFAPDPAGGARLREALGIPAGAPVAGLVARYHPDKDHENFLLAARLVARSRADMLFLLVGDGVDESNEALAGQLDRLGLRARVRLLGVRNDVPTVLSALDVLVSSSRSEGFPQILGEAMACGIPCAATDCGDSREILGSSGLIVPPADPRALAEAVLRLTALPTHEREALAVAARRRVQDLFELGVVARRYAELYAEVVRARSGAAAGTRREGLAR